jgi:hypothetical protein
MLKSDKSIVNIGNQSSLGKNETFINLTMETKMPIKFEN